ncbi:MAG: hypothetical protein ACKV2U_03870 [Bryobacteraceae bacterium]
MELIEGEFTTGGPVAILPGSFHPPTVAHLGLAQAALARVETVIFTLPRAFPHKRYEGVSQSDRIELLSRLTANEPRFAVAVTEGGLFVEMARELRHLRPAIRHVFLVCGRDAAERIVSWPYPKSEPIERQFDQYSLLVAARQGAFTPPRRLLPYIENLITEANWDEVSSTRVRNAIEQGADWRPLVPQRIHDLVDALYSPSRVDSKNVRSR